LGAKNATFGVIASEDPVKIAGNLGAPGDVGPKLNVRCAVVNPVLVRALKIVELMIRP